ncbi:hypothetical protein CYMTET_11600 [Cymbomonas tetramitiformis]|uniref:Uncharacterized protein n=1 Tax=Cymbomonas tetramitiformis TaxID=36881 RepID=A0AAE0GM06_9CHLO|nr:hypothetical protein CYMTET_11600 [Cymbomonas tetramitiformis]
MLPSRAMTSPSPAPERQVVEARLHKEAKSPVCTSEDLSDDSQHVGKRHRRTLKVTESYRVHLEPTGQPLQGWQFRAVRGQGTSALRSKVGTRGLSGLEKVRQREKLKRDYASGLPYLERDSPIDEELLHILAKEQAQEEVEDGLLQYASDLATNDMARAAQDKVIQVALYPPDYPPGDLVQTATAQGLLADAGTYELPWDSDMDDPLDLGDPHAKDDPIECQLNSITDSGDMSPG